MVELAQVVDARGVRLGAGTVVIPFTLYLAVVISWLMQSAMYARSPGSALRTSALIRWLVIKGTHHQMQLCGGPRRGRCRACAVSRAHPCG